MADPKIKDAELGKHEILRELYTNYYGVLIYYTKQLVGDLEIAKDIISEVFTNLLLIPKQFYTGEDAKAYAIVSCRNRAYDHLRASKRKSENLDLSTIAEEADSETVYEEMVRLELIKAIYEEINALPPYAKDVLQLHFKEGLSDQEIAETLGKPVPNIRAFKSQALKLLKQRLLERKISLPLYLLLLDEFF